MPQSCRFSGLTLERRVRSQAEQPPAYPSLLGGYGKPWRGVDGDHQRTMAALREIGEARAGTIDDPPNDGNAGIPAGYTYLGQLLAHDLTFSSLPAPEVGQVAGMPVNLRSPRLDLDCIYGNGPSADALLFQAKPDTDKHRALLRLNDGSAPGRALDLARLGRDPAQHDDTKPCHDALIADVRNDIHLILSQLSLVFMQVHNRVVETLAAKHLSIMPQSGRNRAIYHLARRFVVQSFRSIVVDDYLPRVLDSRVYAYYFGRNASGSQPVGNSVPVEFLLGAARCGHAMTRGAYNINTGQLGVPLSQILDFSSLVDNSSLPVSDKWIVDWSMFFDIGGSQPQLARRFTPFIAPNFSYEALEALLAFDDHGLPVTGKRSLGFLDLARCWDSVPSGQECAKLAIAQAPEDFRIRVLSGAEMLPSAFWHRQNLRVTVPDLQQALQSHAWFTEHTPLPYYLLQEAATHDDSTGALNGARLGPLGSYIIANTVRAALPEGWRLRIARVDMPTMVNWAGGASPLDDHVASFVKDFVTPTS